MTRSSLLITTRLAAPLLLTWTLAGCAPAAAPDTAADVAAIGRLRSDYVAAVQAADAARIAGLYTADGVAMPANEGAVTGREAIQAHEQGLMSQFTVGLTLTSAETKVTGNWAFDRGQFQLTLTPKAAGGAAITDHGKYLVVLEKQADGAWKVAREISNSDMPMMPMANMPMMPPPPPPKGR